MLFSAATIRSICTTNEDTRLHAVRWELKEDDELFSWKGGHVSLGFRGGPGLGVGVLRYSNDAAIAADAIVEALIDVSWPDIQPREALAADKPVLFRRFQRNFALSARRLNPAYQASAPPRELISRRSTVPAPGLNGF